MIEILLTILLWIIMLLFSVIVIVLSIFSSKYRDGDEFENLQKYFDKKK